MAHRSRGNARVIVAVFLVALVGAATFAFLVTRPKPQHANLPTTPPATTQADTQPATTRAVKPPKPRPPTTQYLDVLRTHHPRMPATLPMVVPLDLSQAARIVLPEPIYLSPRSDLWITRADAPPTAEVLARAAKDQADQLTLVVRDHVVFAHWTPNDKGPWTFTVVVRGADGRDEIVTQAGRTPITTGRSYRWERAMDWGDKIVVASATGVAVIQLVPQFHEVHYDLIDSASKPGVTFAEPQFLMDWEGILAWVPWDGKKTGSVGAARFVADRWSPLGPDQGWPEKLLHLVPLYDGGVLQLVPYEEESVRLAFTSLEKLAIDEALVTQLVEKLSDSEDQVRQDSFKELTRYGASAWPVLERLMPDQGPEAQARLKQLLKNRVDPTLGGMSLLGDKLRLVARLADGGAVFYAEVGVATAGEGEEPIIRSPAWISIRPGQAVSLLDAPFTDDLDPDRSRIYAINEEWVVTNNAIGPQRFMGNGFTPLLRKKEMAFSEPVGIDRRGRWLFRRPREAIGAATLPAKSSPATTAPSTVPSSTTTTSPSTSPAEDVYATLILDPTLPDPVPRLPVWVYGTAETVGWDKDNWPAVKRGGSWTLREEDWEPMKRTEKLLTTPAEIPLNAPDAAGASLSTQPASDAMPDKVIAAAPATGAAPVATTTIASATATIRSTTSPTTSTAPADVLGPPLLTDDTGVRYFDGRTKLHVVTADGEQIVWPLPPAANGAAAKVYLVRMPDGLLFLYNQPGRILRIRPTPDETEPFVLEATFTRNVPNADAVTRFWLDPAERLIMAYGNKLAIMFPRGFIPRDIGLKIPDTQMMTEE